MTAFHLCAFVIWSDISEGNKVCMQSVNSARFCVLITFELTVQFQRNFHTEGTDLGGIVPTLSMQIGMEYKSH